MDSDHGQEQAHKRETAAPASQGSVGPLVEAPVADLQGAAPQALLSEPAIGGRGNAPVRNAAVQRMQQTYGNKATRRFLQRAPAGAVPVQRDDTPSLPPVPNYQLTPPSLLQPQDPTARYHLGGDQHLHLDPQVEAMINQHFGLQLDPGNVRGALASLQLGALPAAPAGSSSGTPLSGPSVPQPAPLVPPGAGP